MKSRKCVDVLVTGELFEDIFTQGNTIFARCIEGLPEDSAFVGINYNFDMAVYTLRFEHESFAEVPHGVTFPQMSIMYELISQRNIVKA